MTGMRTLLVALALTSSAAGCDAGGPAEAKAPAMAETTAKDAKTAEPTDAPTDPQAARMVIRTARLRLRDDAPEDIIARATRLAERVGGFVADSNTSGVGESIQQVDATLRVPSDRFEAVLEALRDEGELLQETLSGEDVTEEYTDLTARLRSKRVLEERMLTILSTVDNVEDALRVETELTAVRTEIERLEGRKRVIENRVSLSTIHLSVSSPVRHNPARAETVSSRLDRAVDDAGRAFIAVLAGLIRVVGVLLPLGLLATPIIIGARRAWLRRRRRQMLPPGV